MGRWVLVACKTFPFSDLPFYTGFRLHLLDPVPLFLVSCLGAFFAFPAFDLVLLSTKALREGGCCSVVRSISWSEGFIGRASLVSVESCGLDIGMCRAPCLEKRGIALSHSYSQFPCHEAFEDCFDWQFHFPSIRVI